MKRIEINEINPGMVITFNYHGGSTPRGGERVVLVQEVVMGSNNHGPVYVKGIDLVKQEARQYRTANMSGDSLCVAKTTAMPFMVSRRIVSENVEALSGESLAQLTSDLLNCKLGYFDKTSGEVVIIEDATDPAWTHFHAKNGNQNGGARATAEFVTSDGQRHDITINGGGVSLDLIAMNTPEDLLRHLKGLLD